MRFCNKLISFELNCCPAKYKMQQCCCCCCNKSKQINQDLGKSEILRMIVFYLNISWTESTGIPCYSWQLHSWKILTTNTQVVHFSKKVILGLFKKWQIQREKSQKQTISSQRLFKTADTETVNKVCMFCIYLKSKK